jgi:tetratricopeptide (TPR) repeat protein
MKPLLRRWTNRLLPLCLLALLAGCGSLPVSKDGGASPEKPEPAAKARLRGEYNDAVALMQAGKLDRAEQAFNGLVRRQPELSGPYINLGLIYERTEREAKAREMFEAAVKRGSKSPVPHNELGIMYRKAGEFTKARTQYEKALKLDPGYALGHLNLGILYDLYLRQPEKALEHYKRYQGLLQEQDKKVSLWIVDLQRRIQAASGKQAKR